MDGLRTRLHASGQLDWQRPDLHNIPYLEQSAVEGHRLRDHLLRDHGRSERAIDGLPLEDLHRFEHVEQAMGLNDLSHWHSADGAPPGRVAAEANDAGHRS
jgi:hypothetical protein